MKQFPFNIAHLITQIHSTLRFLQQAKVAVSDCKMKQFLLQANGLQVFPGKKSPSKFYFQIFKLQLQNASVSPQTHDLSVSQTLHIPLSCLYAIMNHLVTDQFLVRAFIAPDFVFYSPGPLGDPAGFRYTSAKRSISFSAAVV